MTYSQSGTSSTLTVGPAVGTYPGAPTNRTYTYQLIGASTPTSVQVDGSPTTNWSYNPTTATLTVTPPAASVTQPLTITERSSTAEGPYGGTAPPLPGTVQAENYDTGGQGVAHSVAAVTGTGNNYRSDGVDLETTTDTGGGSDLGWTGSSQYFKYTVSAATAGTYQVSFRVAAPSAVTDGFHLSNAAGTNLSGNMNVRPPEDGRPGPPSPCPQANKPSPSTRTTGGWNIHQLTIA